MSVTDTIGQDAAHGHSATWPRPDHQIVVIGAGLAGLGMAKELLEDGRDDFVVFERADDIGGVWRDNTYPGIGVDIPSHAYQFEFFPNPDWSRMYPTGSEVWAYQHELAKRYGLWPHIRLGHHVTQRQWSAEHEWWELTVNGQTITSRWVISAIGNFVLAKDPQIAGLEDYGGKLLRSGAWDHDYDIAGKRVAIIGTGASAVQIVPSIAERVAHLDVYQRTPIWIVPKMDPAMRPRIRRLFRRFPRTQCFVSDGLRSLMEFLLIKGVLNYESRATRRTVRGIEWLLRDVFYRRCVPDPELRRRLTPQYGFGCKRPALSSTYLRTFNRPDVELVTDPIETLTATGIRTRDGHERPVDAIVLATGFHMAHEPELYRREPVRGRNGFDLATQYADHRARSYEGIAVPRLPNHLFIYGPYGGTGGTYHEVVKAGAIHILRLLAEADRRGATCVEVTDEATDRWTAFARARMAPTLFNHNNCANSNSYYFDPNGDIPFLRPTSAAEAVDAHGRFPFDDYVFSREQHHL